MSRNNIISLSEENKIKKIKEQDEYIANSKFFYKINELRPGLEFIRYHIFGPERYTIPSDALCRVESVETSGKGNRQVVIIRYNNLSKNNGNIREATIFVNKEKKTPIALYGAGYSIQYFAFKKCDNNVIHNSNNKKPLLNNLKKGDFAIIPNNNSTFTVVKIIDINENGTKNIVPIFENLKILN
jgi:hypothetical protein